MSIQPVFFIKAKNKLTQTVVDLNLERDMASFSAVKRFKRVGSWQLVLQDQPDINPSPHAATFLRDASGNLHNGIHVMLDNQDSQGLQYVISGPQTSVDVRRDSSGLRTITAIGACELYNLDSLKALQVPHFPYPYLATSLSPFFPAGFEPNWYTIPEFVNLVDFFTLGDTSGTTAVESNVGHNGTYNGGFTLNQPGLVDDPRGCVLLNGTTGFVSMLTTGIPSGNSHVGFVGWGMLPTLGGVAYTMASWGTNAAGQALQLGINGSNHPYFGVATSNTASTATVIAGVPFLLGLAWDGTTLRGFFYQMQPGGLVANQWTATPGTLSITFGNAFLGKYLSGVQFWNGYLGMVGFYNTGLSAASIANLASVGISKLSYLAYDTPGAQQASMAIMYSVLRNASTAVPSGFANYGIAEPQTAFTNAWSGTHGARAVPTLTMAADPAVGSIINNVARMDNLLDYIGGLSLQSSPELGFKLEQSGAGLLFTVFQPADKRLTAVFSIDRRNLLQGYEWQDSVANGNHIYVGGSNPAGTTTLTDRLFTEVEDSTSVSQNGYREDFLDYRQGQDNQTLQQVGNAQLLQDKSPLNINAVVVGTDQLYFKGPSGKNWDLGDQVTVLADGQVFQQIIREIEIDLQPGAIPVITAAIGTPVDTQIIQEMQTIQSNVKALQDGSETLKTKF